MYLMYRVIQELVDRVLVKLLMVVNGNICLLFQDVVESWCPFPATKAGCVGAVVHHEGNTPSMHVGVQAVCCLDDALITDLTVWMTLQHTQLVSQQVRKQDANIVIQSNFGQLMTICETNKFEETATVQPVCGLNDAFIAESAIGSQLSVTK